MVRLGWMLALAAFSVPYATGSAGAATGQGARPVVTGSSGIELVDGGCGGPEYFRADNGRCYLKREYRRPPPPREYRECPYGYHPTPYGCRPNY